MRNRNDNNQKTIDNWYEYGINPKKRRIYLGSAEFDSGGKELGIDAKTAELFIKGLDLLNNQNNRKIVVVMNTIGGDWFHGMAIYDSIRSSSAPVDIEVRGQAMSMGAVILQAGRYRLLHPNSAIMIHDGTTDNKDMPVQSAVNWVKYEQFMCKSMYEIFAKRSGQIPSYWKRKCSHDYIMTPEEAVQQGLADKVLQPSRNLPCKKSIKKR